MYFEITTINMLLVSVTIEIHTMLKEPIITKSIIRLGEICIDDS